MSRLPPSIARCLRLPVIAAPMLRVSGPDLVRAACQAGVIGAFPTANCRDVAELSLWLEGFSRDIGDNHAPWCPNLIMRRATLQDELACVLRHRARVVITSVGAPDPVISPLHDIGCLVLADVASIRHAQRAAAAGVDGLVLLSAGAGGQTGWANGLAFARAVRDFYDGPLVLAGGVTDGASLLAARALDCDLAYMGTRFIATQESMASAAYKAMLVNSSLDDVVLTRAFTGLQTNMLRPSVAAAGLDPDALPEDLSLQRAGELYAGHQPQSGLRRWTDIWSAGHSVSGVHGVPAVAELVDSLEHSYREAWTRLQACAPSEPVPSLS